MGPMRCIVVSIVFVVLGVLSGLMGCDSTKTCRLDGDCVAPLVCTQQTCQKPPSTSCAADRDCPSAYPRCDTKTKRCVECKAKADCKQGFDCKDTRCTPEEGLPCQKHDDCKGTVFPYCSSGGTCSWQCRVDGDCKGGEKCNLHRCRNPTGNKFCITHADCKGEPKKFCSTAGDCSWECAENTDCTGGKVCKGNVCRKESGCASDADCKDSAKPSCNTRSGLCEPNPPAGCTADTDCTDSAKPTCNTATGQCEAAPPTKCTQDSDCTEPGKPTCNTTSGVCEAAPPTKCTSDNDCAAPSPKCDTKSGKCVGCLNDGDCTDAKAPLCKGGTCQPKPGTGCSSGCPSGQFCFDGARCLPNPKACTTSDECAQGEACVEAGARNLCLPACDPTKNKSADDLTNPACWGNYGWCYSLSDTDPKEGSCFPPQLERRKVKETCNDDANPDKPSYHTCNTGMTCVEISATEKRCWINCDPKKNVGGDPSVEDKNPDCDGGKGKCSPLDGGAGACDPDSSTTTPPKAQAPKPGELVINELLADPPIGNAGDANKDGTRSATGDEFAELLNTTNKTLLLEGVVYAEKSASNKVYFTFPKGIQLAPGQAVVIFGGGMAADNDVGTGKPHPKFGGALVFVAKGVGLGNSGKIMEIKDASGTSLDTFAYGSAGCEGGKDQSVTRSPDGTGSCKLHKDADPNKSAFSPGTKADGSKF